MTEHTPTPWKLDIEVYETWSEGQVQNITIETEDKLIASYKTHFIEYPQTDEENAANAAFIVKAVNNHEALLDALKFALEIMESYAFSSGTDPRTATPESAIGRARAAIASVGSAGRTDS